MPAILNKSFKGGMDLNIPDRKFAVEGVPFPLPILSQTVILSILIPLIASTCVFISSGSLSATISITAF